MTAAIRAEHGLSIEMIEKDFHVASRDDPAIVSIVEGLALPLSPAQMPPRPQLPPVSARPVRPTAQQMFRSKASGAAAAARRAALVSLASAACSAPSISIGAAPPLSAPSSSVASPPVAPVSRI